MSHRAPWSDLPAPVHDWVAGLLGAPVVSATAQTGGFSPASADRVAAANGARAFVKVVHASWNERTVDLQRSEAHVARAMPPGYPAPALLGELDTDGWHGLAFTEIDGAHPAQPWRDSDLDAVLAALDFAAGLGTPCPVPDLPRLVDQIGDDLRGFERVTHDPPAGLDPWLARHLGTLRAAALRGIGQLAGETLVHMDVRADNLLLDRDHRVWVIDWPWACRGATWADSALFLLSCVSSAGADEVGRRLDDLMGRHGLAPQVATDLATGFTSFFVDAVRRPPPPGMSAVTQHRRRQADALVPFLRGNGGRGCAD